MHITIKQLKNFLAQRSIKSKLVASFSASTFILVLIIIAFFWFDFTKDSMNLVTRNLAELNLKINQVNSIEKDFYTLETQREAFYSTSKSQLLDSHKIIVQDIKQSLKNLKLNSNLQDSKIASLIDKVNNRIENFEFLFDKLVGLIKRRGLGAYGLLGEMQNVLVSLQNIYFADNTLILAIRQYEKDFILLQDKKWAEKAIQLADSLQKITETSVRNEEQKRAIRKHIDLYKSIFITLINTEKEIGSIQPPGLKGELVSFSTEIEKNIRTIEKMVYKRLDRVSSKLFTLLVVLSILFIVLNIGLTAYVVQKLGKPINHLAESIQEVIRHNFEKGKEIKTIWASDETGKIAQQVEIMLNKVREHKQEILNQKEQIAQGLENIKLLSRIGQEITSNLSIDSVLQVIHQNLTPLMEVDYLAIYAYQRYQQRIALMAEFGNILPFQPKRKLDVSHQLAEKVFHTQQTLIIQNFCDEKNQISLMCELSDETSKYQSLVFIPLVANNESIGVFTIQSPTPNAYADFELDLLQNMAVYIKIALENANLYKRMNEKNQKIIDSITYAQRIQQAMLPKFSSIQTIFPESFICYLPRDIVSGDFYWFAEIESPLSHSKQQKNSTQIFKKYALIVADCTGHGVPGALMSMIGNELLNHIILEEHIISPDEILLQLHKGIRNALKQSETQNSDGMDIGICIIDLENAELEYAGAYHPLVYFQNEQFHLIKADKSPVGGWYEEGEQIKFQKHTIKLDASTTFYLFSDGFNDQLGGEYRKKFMSSQLYALLGEIHLQEMNAQAEILTQTLEKWIGTGKQNDDILLIGCRINIQAVK